MTPKPPKIGVTILTISRVDGCGIWRRLRPRDRSIDRLLKVLRYGAQRGCWIDWRIVFFDEVSR